MSSSPAPNDTATTVSVVVPTYRRPDMLVGLVRALHAQDHAPLEVLICYRSDDGDTSAALKGLPEDERGLVREVRLEPGANLAAGLRAGIASSRGELVALTDDDAEPPREWISRLISALSDTSITAIGGRDRLQDNQDRCPVVGKVQWFGRLIGGHHGGFGDPREVDVLKGVNCCFRGDPLRRLGVDKRLVGAGNVMHWELALCLPLVRDGRRLVYDPNLTLLHHVAPRHEGDANHRGGFDAQSLTDLVHNETFLLLDHLSPPGKVAYLIWCTLAGVRLTPGVVQTLRLALTTGRPLSACRRFAATMRGRGAGFWTWLRSPSKVRRELEPLGRTGRADA